MKKLVSIVMAIALGVSLAGCGGRASAESVVEDAIQAFQNADAEAIEQYWGDTDFSSSNGTAEEDAYTQQLLEQLAENLSYQITESTENENAGTATVTVEFTNIDMKMRVLPR